MTNPNPNPVDERLRADLRSVLQRDPDALHNADHLQGLLADLAPDMPSALRAACVAVARSNATNWLTQTPPYSEEQVVNWLRSQYPDVQPDAARQAVAAFAALSRTGAGTLGAAERATPVGAAVASPVFDEPTVAGTVEQPLAPPPAVTPPPGPGPVSPSSTGPIPQFPPTVMSDRPPAANAMTQMPQHPSLPPQHPSLPPQQGGWVAPPPPPPPPNRRKVWLIAAVVAVLLIGGGVGAFFLLKGGDTKLAAPKDVAAKLDGTAITVTWQPVPKADHYVVTDTSGALGSKTVSSASATFGTGATQNHTFVVTAYTKDNKGGDKSQSATWSAVLAGPKDVSISASGNDLNMTWSAVPGAASYQVGASDDSSFQPQSVSGTSVTLKNVVYTEHHFVVSAVQGGKAGLPSFKAWTPDKPLTAAQAALAYKLPADMVEPGSCISSYVTGTDKSYVSAVVSCSPANVSSSDGPKNLYADQINDGDYQSFVNSHFGTNLPQRKGCDDSFPSAVSQWYWVNGNNQKQGDEFCWYNSDSDTSVFAWSYLAANVVVQVEGSYPTTRTGLHDWWGTNLDFLN
jgi:hypothetical protein